MKYSIKSAYLGKKQFLEILYSLSSVKRGTFFFLTSVKGNSRYIRVVGCLRDHARYIGDLLNAHFYMRYVTGTIVLIVPNRRLRQDRKVPGSYKENPLQPSIFENFYDGYVVDKKKAVYDIRGFLLGECSLEEFIKYAENAIKDVKMRYGVELVRRFLREKGTIKKDGVYRLLDNLCWPGLHFSLDPQGR